MLLVLFLSFPSVVAAQESLYSGRTVVQHQVGQIAVLPQPHPIGAPNSAGWNTGYSVVTSTQERDNPFGASQDDSIVETVTKVVPNDALGRPLVAGIRPFEEPNSAGWSTGYSAVTSTYERPDPLGHALGRGETVTETVTRVVPNDAMGNPMRGLFPYWP